MNSRKIIQPLKRKAVQHLDLYDEGQLYENIFQETKLIKKCQYDSEQTWEEINQKKGCLDNFKYIYQQPGLSVFSDQQEELEQNQEQEEESQQQFISHARSRSYDCTSFSDLKFMNMDLGEGKVLKVDEINYLEDFQTDIKESCKKRRKKLNNHGLRKKIQKFEIN